MTAASKKKSIERVLAYTEYQGQLGCAELVAWLQASTVAGFALPASIQPLVDSACHLQDQRAALRRPEPGPAHPAEGMLNQTAAQIRKATEEAATNAAHYAADMDMIVKGEGVLGWTCEDVFREERDGLIRGPLRDAIAVVLSEAAKVADKLAHHAPFADRQLLLNATPEELQLWRDSRTPQATLATLQRTWLLSFGRSAVRGGVVDPGLRPERPGGYFAWVDPEAVPDDGLRLGHDTDILRIASAPAEYRLLAPSELQPLIDEMNAALPGTPLAVRGPNTSPVAKIKRGVVAGA